jgi:SAM-dependent methyltransferase
MTSARLRRPTLAGHLVARRRHGQRAALVTEESFDRLLPRELRDLACHHFTPVVVAERAASMLVDRPGRRVLDVGSGIGKFCLVGAAYTDGVFVGVEQRPHLVSVAEDLARTLAIDNVSFVHADMAEIDWAQFDGFYLFNPFSEHALPSSRPLDDTIERSRDHFRSHVHAVRSRLGQARVGTRVVTLHGFGGTMPPGYVCVAEQAIRSDWLRLWIKTEEGPSWQRGDTSGHCADHHRRG